MLPVQRIQQHNHRQSRGVDSAVTFATGWLRLLERAAQIVGRKDNGITIVQADPFEASRSAVLYLTNRLGLSHPSDRLNVASANALAAYKHSRTMRSLQERAATMPLYEYSCQACQGRFELLVRNSECVQCPECGSPRLEKLLSVPAAHINGSGLPMYDGPAGGGCGRPQCGQGGCQGMM